MRKWKKLLNETKPTKKYFGDVPRRLNPLSPKDQSYNRAITSMMGQGDFRSTLKVWLGQFMENSKRSADIEELAERATEEEKVQAGKDLNIMRHIYSGKTNYDIYIKDNIRSGIMYDNQPKVVGPPVEKIDFALEQFGIPVSYATPSAEEVEEVYEYYVHPNWHLTKAKPVPDEIADRFKKNLALSQTSAFQKRQAELDALNRQKAIERKKELARRRRERRRNK